MKNKQIEKAILNLISDPYDKDNCFYGHIIAQCEIHIDDTFDGIAGVGYWNDMFQLYINPDLFTIFTLKEQKAILIHEAMHIIFNHISRQSDKVHLQWNIATDAAINQFIDNLPEGSIYPETLGKEKDKYAEYYYEYIDINIIKRCCKSKISTNTCCSGKLQDDEIYSNIDSHTLWDKSSNDKNDNFSKQACQSMIDKAIEKSIGNIPTPVQKALKLLNKDSQVPWQKILKRIMGNSKKYFEPSYKKVNRRFPNRIDLPGKKAIFIPTLVCIVDVSGSMSNKEILKGIIEIQQICKLTNHKLVVIQVDTEVQDITTTDFKNHKFTRNGCGGTELYPAVDYINKNKIDNDILVFITDGHFGFYSWLKMPKVPMLFLITDKNCKINLPTKRSYQFVLE
ncbi:MAG: hypothetical protein DRG78_00915 [Epsilonproteobacteria bacterium]|nr:MAG: hypothetical protein DRG78_00915 [Campylobacterota bacterium]